MVALSPDIGIFIGLGGRMLPETDPACLRAGGVFLCRPTKKSSLVEKNLERADAKANLAECLQPQPDWNRPSQTPRQASIASSWRPYNQGQGYCIPHSMRHNGRSSDDYMTSNSALPRG